MKKVLQFFGKAIAGGLIALVVLSLFSLVYYNPPLAQTQPDKSTNIKYLPGQVWTFMIEGIGFGRINESGYNSSYFADNENPDVVVIGSSHMEALQVGDKANATYLLNEKFHTDKSTSNDLKCINIGVSGHFFEISVSNFQSIADKYPNAKYMILETINTKYDNDSLDKMMAGEYHSDFDETGFVRNLIKKIPYARLLHKKITERTPAAETASDPVPGDDFEGYESRMDKVFEKLTSICEKNGAKLIILTHDILYLDDEGNFTRDEDEQYLSRFYAICEKYNVDVVDVVPDFIENYKENKTLPYGYRNTKPGEGHLNKLGHKIIADRLYDKLNEMAGETNGI